MEIVEIYGRNPNSAPASIEKVRQELKDVVLKDAKTMVEAMIKESKEKANVPAMKFLFEMVGLFPAEKNADLAESDSLAQTLLSRLGFLDEKSDQGAVTKECAGSRASDGDAVE